MSKFPPYIFCYYSMACRLCTYCAVEGGGAKFCYDLITW